MACKLSFSFSCILFLFTIVLPIYSHDITNPSPFGFLRNMQGCHKGQKVKGIHDLKLYLSHFGYLNYQNDQYQNVTNLEEGHFDDEIEAAIKSYQAFYHLNVTGALDAPTVSKMAMPRCGFPDKETNQHGDHNISLHTVSRYRFFHGRPKWARGKRRLTYAFGSRFPTRFMPPVARAFRRWAIASRYFTFSRARSYRSADLKISFARRAHGDGSPFDGPGGVLAHAFCPPDGRLHFDADDLWAVGAVSNAYDVETLALHEIGHLLGLGHSQYPNAIMWATFSAGETKGLNSDDIRGLRALYTI